MTYQNNPPVVSRLSQPLTTICLAVGIILALIIAGKTTSAAMQFHALILIVTFFAGIVALFNLGGRINDAEHKPSPSGVYYNNTIVKYGVIASCFWGIAAPIKLPLKGQWKILVVVKSQNNLIYKLEDRILVK